jgi:hypothetical protein
MQTVPDPNILRNMKNIVTIPGGISCYDMPRKMYAK